MDAANPIGREAPMHAAASAPELLAAAFESSAAGIAVLAGGDLHFVRANAAYRALLPRPDEDPAGRTFVEVWPSEDPAVGDALRRVLSTGEPEHREHHVVSFGPGDVRRFSFHAKRVLAAGGPEVLLVMWETTALEDAWLAAEESAASAVRQAAEVDAVLSAIVDGLAIFGPSGEVLRANEAASRLLGFDGRVRALPLAERVAALHLATPEGKQLPPDQLPVSRALAGETVRGVRLRLHPVHLPGPIWLSASAAPIRGSLGEVSGAVLTFSDETAVQILEQERDDLVRMISHDLRTPLSAVLTQAHLLRRHPEDAAKVAERAGAIVRSCERMSGMIQDLAEAAMLDAGQVALSCSEVDLASLMPELLERFRGGLEVERVRVVLQPDLPPVRADPARLERILVNLLSNALKYSPPQSEVTVEIVSRPEGLVISVADHGIGIAPEDLPHVFDRFFRARGARRPEGLGLGLYIARFLVELHGGTLTAESHLGQGSTFRVVLPIRAA